MKELPTIEQAYREGAKRFKGRNHVDWKAKIFAAGAMWMKAQAIGGSDIIGSKDYVGNPTKQEATA